eukprot:158489_1
MKMCMFCVSLKVAHSVISIRVVVNIACLACTTTNKDGIDEMAHSNHNKIPQNLYGFLNRYRSIPFTSCMILMVYLDRIFALKLSVETCVVRLWHVCVCVLLQLFISK